MAGSRSTFPHRIRRILSDSLHRQAAAGATWTLAGSVVARLATLAATVALLRVLGTNGFGGLVFVQSTAATLATLSGLGLALATTRFVAEQLESNPQRAGSYLMSAVSLCLVSGTLLGFSLLVSSPQLAADVLGKSSLATPLAVSSLLLLVSPLADVLAGGIRGLQNFRRLGWVTGARGALDGILLIVGALTGGITGGILGLVVAEALSCLITGVALHRTARANAIQLRLELDNSVMPSLIRFALPSLSTALLLTGTFWLGQVLLAHQPGGLTDVGVFVFAQRFYLAALFLPGVIAAVLFPMLSTLTATGRFVRFRKLLRSYLAITVLLATLGTIALLLLAGFATLLRGHSGVIQARTLGVLALVAIPSALNNALSQAAIALRRIGWWLFSDVVLAIVLLVVAWILVPSHGSVGLAVAYLAGYLATCLAILPAFLAIPTTDTAQEPVVGSAPVPISWEVAGSTVGIVDALPQITRVNGEPSPSHEPEPPTPWVPRGRRRIRLATPKPQRSLAVPVVLAVAFLVVVSWSGTRNFVNLDTYPALAIGPLVFVSVQLVSPRARLRLDTPLCPANWGWFLFAVQLIVQPSLLIIFGPAKGQLFSLPNPSAVQEAFILSCLAYITYAVGLTLVLRRPPIDRPIGGNLDNVSPGAVAILILIGVAALFWRFHSIGQLFSYFSGQNSANATTATLAEAASTFLRPLGVYGLILLWARSAESTRVHRLRFVLSGAGALVILATYNYNRAAVVIPLVALVAAYGRHIRRLRVRSIAVFGVVLLLVAATFGNYRRIVVGTEGGRISQQQAGISGTPSLESQVQLYGAAPQFSGLVIQDLPEVGGLAYGRTMISSVVSPIPVVGKTFRATNGTVRYNALVYGQSGTVDQVLPFLGELYWNFGPLGVAAGFLLVGMTLAAFQRRFDASGGILAAFIFQYFGMWVAFLIIGSIEVVAQIVVYFTLPIAVVALAPKVRQSGHESGKPPVYGSERSRV